MIKTNKRGLYIVIEGLDGSGKSSIATKLVEMINKDLPNHFGTTGLNIHHRREPSHEGNGKRMRDLLMSKEFLHEEDEVTLAQYMLLDRIENTTTITGLLREGHIVIQERNFLTALAYNEAKNTEMVRYIQEINKVSLKPDLLVYIDVDEGILADRLSSRGDKADAYEKPELLAKRHQGYRDNSVYIDRSYMNNNLADQENILTVLMNYISRSMY